MKRIAKEDMPMRCSGRLLIGVENPTDNDAVLMWRLESDSSGGFNLFENGIAGIGAGAE